MTGGWQSRGQLRLALLLALLEVYRWRLSVAFTHCPGTGCRPVAPGFFSKAASSAGARRPRWEQSARWAKPGESWEPEEEPSIGPAILEGKVDILKLPDRFVGGSYFLLNLSVRHGDTKFAVSPSTAAETQLTLLLDTGLTAAAMLTSEVCTRLNLPVGGEVGTGIGATGTSMAMPSVRIEGAALIVRPHHTTVDQARILPLPALSGVVVDDFPQLKIGKEIGISLDGMLGQGFMQRCDLELDCETSTVRAWPPASLSQDPGWRLLEALGMPGHLQGLLLSVPGCMEPVVGLVDSGASHTVVNKKAAYVLSLHMDEKAQGRKVRGIGLDNSVIEMPLIRLANATLAGARHVTISPHRPGAGVGLRSWRFRNTGAVTPGVKIARFPGEVEVAIGDIGFFQELLSQEQDSIGDFDGPVALIGQDLLTQLPMRYSAATGRIWFKQ
eukprot:TRINITY_DN105395_c0_g1_i1.p1 TRINITY_DN105395_c0_g1~~TRINITY_DN105395_c0_g1_i1.p1  ORF type:complete len:442 (+),score=75.97 TRINITY_DN105395_c0_g1_i1:25-1350(+)